MSLFGGRKIIEKEGWSEEKEKALLCLIPCGEWFCPNELLLPTNVGTEGQTKGGPGLCPSCSQGLLRSLLRQLKGAFHLPNQALWGAGSVQHKGRASPSSSEHTSVFWTQKATNYVSLAVLFKLPPGASWCGTEPTPDLTVTMVVLIFFSLKLLKN